MFLFGSGLFSVRIATRCNFYARRDELSSTRCQNIGSLSLAEFAATMTRTERSQRLDMEDNEPLCTGSAGRVIGSYASPPCGQVKEKVAPCPSDETTHARPPTLST